MKSDKTNSTPNLHEPPPTPSRPDLVHLKSQFFYFEC